jgi:pimeloyl-ACP methyl ester carboxylesterase
MESDVIAVMDHLGLQHVDIVGWSDGGIIGLVMARDHPSRLHSLFSFAPNSDPSGVLDVSASPVFNEYVERAGQEYLLISPTPTQVAYDYFVANISNMWATQPSFTAPTFAAMTSNNTNPILIVDGDHEEAIKRVDTLFIADSNVNFGLVLLPRVSHFAFIQDPLTFNNAIFSWLKIAQVGTPSAPAAPTSSASVPSISLFLVALIASFAAMF